MAPRAAQESKRKTNLGSLAHLGVPKGSPLGTMFSIFFVIFGVFLSLFFSKLCLGGFWALFFMGLGCSLVVFFDVLFCVSGASITKENVVLIQYLLSKHIYLFDKRRKVYKFDTFFRDTSGSGLGSGFWKDLGSICGAPWHPLTSPIWKMEVRRTV